jgi:diaminohydroxyphosphoribosylaminopyrimidine deaminase/5-amino-6-(5-phosphoribosylamino)uracil reductase
VLEGGPTLAASFLRVGLVDKLLAFVAPTLAGQGPGMLTGGLESPVILHRLSARAVGQDVLLEAYVKSP